MTKLYNDSDEDTTDRVITDPPKKTPDGGDAVEIIKPVTLAMKQAYLPRVACDKRFRKGAKVEIEGKDGRKRRVSLTPADVGVLNCIVSHCNTERGYSYIGARGISTISGLWPSSVSKSIDKLVSLGIIDIIQNQRRRQARRYVPRWRAYLDLGDPSHEEFLGDPSHKEFSGDPSQEKARVTPRKEVVIKGRGCVKT